MTTTLRSQQPRSTPTSPSTKLKPRLPSRRFIDPTQPRWLGFLNRGAVVIALVAVTYFLIFPIVPLIVGAFRTSPLSADAMWTLSGFERILSDSSTPLAFLSSFVFATVTTIGAMSLAVFLAACATRLDFPLRRVITPMMVILAVAPSLFYVLSWSMLGSPDGGLVSLALRSIGLGELAGSFDVYSWPGMLLVGTLKVSGLAFLLVIAAVQNMDRGMEDAAVMAGASPLAAFCRVGLPSLLPALTSAGALIFIAGLETFEIPVTLGRPAGIKTLSVQVYEYINGGMTSDYAAASALSTVFIAILVILLLVQSRLTRRRDFGVVGGKGRVQPRVSPGRAAPWLTAAVALMAVIGILLPLVQVVVGSFQGYFGIYESWTLANYENVFASSPTVRALFDTLGIAVGGGAVAVIIAFVVSYVVVRRPQTFEASFLRFATWVPAMAPGIVLSLALLWTYLYTPVVRELYGTMWLMLAALIVSAMPVAARNIEGNLVQVRVELEEAARLSGASAFFTSIAVTARICTPALLTAWLLVGLHMSGRLDVPLLLQSTRSQTVATLAFTLFDRGMVSEAAAVYCAYMLILLLVVVAIMALTRLTGSVSLGRIIRLMERSGR